MRWPVLSLVGATCLAALPAAGQAPSSGADDQAEGLSLRALEEELFAVPTPTSPALATGVRVTASPAASSSDVPPAPLVPARATPADLSWLEDLVLPDLPVRWDERVVRYLEFFREDPRGRRIIGAWLRRLDRYGPVIERTLSAHGLPADIRIVAMVESGYDPTARSWAGAAGMWQFVPATGEEYGLTRDHWVDLRLDPVRSTEAAARYLKLLHDRFGSWELALAAYNVGYGRLMRSIRRYNTNDYWELSHLENALPFETNLYVAKILACAIVARNPARFGFADLEREAPVTWETVRVPAGTSLRRIARLASVELAAIEALNPALRRGRVPPGEGPREVRVPAGAGDRFALRWARQGARPLVARPHVVRFGEQVPDIAREHGSTPRAVRALNDLAEDEEPGPGTVLLVPQRRSPPERADGADESPEVIAVRSPLEEVPGRRRVFYRCIRGDRAADVARFFGVAQEDVHRWNRLDPAAALQPGMVLQLFVPPGVDLTRALVLTPEDARVLGVGSEEFFAYHEEQEGRVRFRYTVREGDTLVSIGRRFGLSTASLSRINQIGRRTELEPGEELIVYAEPERAPRSARASPDVASSPAAPPEPEPGAAEPAGAAAEPTGAQAEPGVAAPPRAAAEPTAAQAEPGPVSEPAPAGENEADEGDAPVTEVYM
ncbi:MAG: transglycosylase SLT domain-containing protein [Sandaracinaceae bacterium]